MVVISLGGLGDCHARIILVNAIWPENRDAPFHPTELSGKTLQQDLICISRLASDVLLITVCSHKFVCFHSSELFQESIRSEARQPLPLLSACSVLAVFTYT